MVYYVAYVSFFILVYIDHVVMELYAILLLLLLNKNLLPTYKIQLNQCQLLSLMNPRLYLLSTTCAHLCYFPSLHSTRKS